jgi:hypothetical protein
MVRSEKSRRWCFTVNNHTPEDECLMQTLPCKYLVYGNEVGESNTPHMQGFTIFEGTKTMVAMKKIHPTCHWEITKKTSETASNYCKKGEQPKSEWDKHHDDGPNFGLNWVGFEKGDFPDHQGKRTELEDFKEAVEGGMINPRDLRKQHSIVWSRHRRFAMEYIIDHKPYVQLDQHPLRRWQKELIESLDGPIDKRKIHFIVDRKGNQGKSWFAEHYRQLHPLNTIVCLPGKKADMVYAASANGFDPRVVILDTPRSKQSRKVGDTTESALMYDFQEEMKNGSILNNKYESYMWRFPRPHFVVLTNSVPDFTALSLDRYLVWEVNSNGTYVVLTTNEVRTLCDLANEERVESRSRRKG